MTVETFKHFNTIMSKYKAKRKILVGSEIYDRILELYKEIPSKFIFIKYDLLKDTIIFFTKEYHPLGNKAVTIDNIIALEEYVNSIPYLVRAFEISGTENRIMIYHGNDKRTILLLEDNNIKAAL